MVEGGLYADIAVQTRDAAFSGFHKVNCIFYLEVCLAIF